MCSTGHTGIIMNKDLNTTVVLRSVGEQTEDMSRKILVDVFGVENVFMVKDVAPFSLAVKRCFEVGIRQNKKWTLLVDADVLIFKDKMPGFIALVDSAFQCERYCEGFCFQGELFDKLLKRWREVGVHLYQTRLLPKALEFIAAGAYDLRPETYVKKRMADIGHSHYVSKYPLGIHDFFQHPASIVKKAVLHCKKHEGMREVRSFWLKNSATDKDFYWALKGVELFESLSDDNMLVDYRFMDGLLQKYGLNPAAEHSNPDLVEQTLASYSEHAPGEHTLFKECQKQSKLLKYIFHREKFDDKRIVHVFGLKFSYTKARLGSFFKYRNEFSELTQKKLLYRKLSKRFDYKFNFDNPKTFNEKLNWLKLYWQHPLMTLHADKYKVRDIVKGKVGEKYLIPMLGAWDMPEDIDFEAMPEQFVLKVNWGYGQNIIVKNKALLDKGQTVILLGEWLKPESNSYWQYLEWSYKNIKPKIIGEQYIKDLEKGQVCYNIMCFNGKPRIVQVAYGDKQSNSAVDYFDWQWQRLPFTQNLPNISKPYAAPSNFSEMLELANTLAQPFPFVRIDLFNTNGKIYFSECTFYPNAGNAPFKPSEWDLKLGEMLQLPEKYTAKTTGFF
jgi:hypothetical protein